MSARRRPVRAGRVVAWVLLWLWIAITVIPLLWMLRTSLTTNSELFSGAQGLLPQRPTLVNFKRVLGFSSQAEAAAAGGTGAEFNYLRYVANSLAFTAVTVFGQVAFCTAAGYAFARLRFRGRDQIFALFLLGLLVPGIFTTIPNFVLIKNLGLLNTFPGLIAPFLLMSPFAIFFMRQFFLSFPVEVEEAARLDGLGRFRTFWQVVLPMSRPPMITLAVITAVTQWNEFLWPLLVANQDAVRVITVALSVFQSQSPGTQVDWSGLMAASSLSVIPVALILLVFGRRMVGSIQLTGFK